MAYRVLACVPHPCPIDHPDAQQEWVYTVQSPEHGMVQVVSAVAPEVVRARDSPYALHVALDWSVDNRPCKRRLYRGVWSSGLFAIPTDEIGYKLIFPSFRWRVMEELVASENQATDARASTSP